MSLPFVGFDTEYYTTILLGALLVAAVHVVPYVVDTHGIRSIPGPWLAKFTDGWLGRVAARGHRSEVVHELHKEYGNSLSHHNNPSASFHVLTTLLPRPQDRSCDSLQTTCQSPTQMPCKSSTPMETVPRRATSMMHSSQSTGASSTPVTDPITPESARSSLTSSP